MSQRGQATKQQKSEASQKRGAADRWVGPGRAAEQVVAGPLPLLPWLCVGLGTQLLSPGHLKGTSGPLTPGSKVGKYKVCLGRGKECSDYSVT